MQFDHIGLQVPEILFPQKGIDLSKWAVVACDQFTSQPEYWKKVKGLVGDNPSTYQLIFPEVFLESKEVNAEQLIQDINQNMKDYLAEGIVTAQNPCFVLVDRSTSHVKSRKGLVVALDLEKYDFNKGSQTLIRATEGTVLDRLPPRIKIRQNALLESPHIMVLIDDPEKTVIEPLFHENLEVIHDIELMLDGGRVKTYKIDQPEIINRIAQRLYNLASKEMMCEKYGTDDKGILLYAMGDGNHSLATAKAIWEENKKNASNKENVMSHPSRFALVELVNVHDEGLVFEPIHRVVFNVNVDDLLSAFKAYYEDKGCAVSQTVFHKETAAEEQLVSMESPEDAHVFAFVMKEMSGFISVQNPSLNLAVGTLQAFLDDYLKAHMQAKIDYIHGASVVTKLGIQEGHIGFYLPPMEKQDLFKTVYCDEALPRKTFSMGEAEEKRYYLECRKIK